MQLGLYTSSTSKLLVASCPLLTSLHDKYPSNSYFARRNSSPPFIPQFSRSSVEHPLTNVPNTMHLRINRSLSENKNDHNIYKSDVINYVNARSKRLSSHGDSHKKQTNRRKCRHLNRNFDNLRSSNRNNHSNLSSDYFSSDIRLNNNQLKDKKCLSNICEDSEVSPRCMLLDTAVLNGLMANERIGRASSWYSIDQFHDGSSPEDASSEEFDSKSQESNSDLSRKWSSLGRFSSDSSLCDGSPLGSIRTSDVKQKNYLFGGLGSLLGPSELERYFPDRSVTIFIATWNMNGKEPPSSLDDFLLPDDLDHMPDMYVIGTQESTGDRTEWEVRLQTTIGPSHVLFTSAVLGILHLTLFLRRDLVWFCTVPEEASCSLRPGTYFKTKGAVSLSLQFFGTKMLFVNTHLFAHEEKFATRIQNYKTIIQNLDVPRNLRGSKLNKHKDVTHRYDVVFWMGDLNFRLVGDRDEIMNKIKLASNPSSNVEMKELMEYDQLSQAKAKGQIFHGFDEAPINFPPTFKFDVGTNHYDTSYKQRIPSYTDRIFYKSTRDPILCSSYNSCPLFKTSDHKPVCGVFHFKVRPGKDDVPLAAGLFQRDVYLAALKRRRRFFHQPSTKNCQVQ